MSYLYDMLKDALGGEKVVASKNTVITGWSPNNIKAIVITRSGIIVASHAYLLPGGNYVNVVNLDGRQVLEDLENTSRTNYGKPKLNTLLNRRSLSCLEEIYIDSALMNYPKVIDLLSYVSELTSSGLSRLRYFGYINLKTDTANAMIGTLYSKNQRKVGYSLAKDTSREEFCVIQYKEVGNDTWYSQYNLRPQYYKIDADGSNLSMHFRKIESAMEKGILQEKEEVESNAKSTSIKTIVGFDEENVGYLESLKDIMVYSAKNRSDSVSKVFRESFSKVVSQDRVVRGLSEKDVQASEILLEFYRQCGVFDKNAKGMNAEELKGYLDREKGFLDIPKLLDDISYTFTEKLRKQGYSDLVSMSIIMTRDYLPNDCKIAQNKGIQSNNGSVEGLINLLNELIGR